MIFIMTGFHDGIFFSLSVMIVLMYQYNNSKAQLYFHLIIHVC